MSEVSLGCVRSTITFQSFAESRKRHNEHEQSDEKTDGADPPVVPENSITKWYHPKVKYEPQ